jgi:polyhydroxyalkanoate synthesis regulator phasin
MVRLLRYINRMPFSPNLCHNRRTAVKVGQNTLEDFQYSMDNNNWLNQLLLLGVGTTSIAAEKLKEVSDQLVTDGKLNPDQAAGLVNDLLKQVQANQGDIEAQVQRQIRNMMQDMGVARQSEVDELRGRIDRLERQIRDLENKNWRS